MYLARYIQASKKGIKFSFLVGKIRESWQVERFLMYRQMYGAILLIFLEDLAVVCLRSI